MAKKTASEQALGALHEKLANVLSDMLDDQEVTKPTGKDADGNVITVTETIKPSAGVLAVAAKFLKDNSIFADPDQSGAMSEFEQKLNRRGKPSKQDLKDAMNEVGGQLLQ